MENLPLPLSPLSSVLTPRSDIRPIIDRYLTDHPLSDINPTDPVVTSLNEVLRHGGSLDEGDWTARSLWLTSISLPELGAFDGHKAYLLAGGTYQGPLTEDLKETLDDAKAEAIFAISRALLHAGCYAEAYLMISLRTHSFVLDNDQEHKLIDLKLAASDAFQQTIKQHTEQDAQVTDPDIRQRLAPHDELPNFMLVPVIRDGRVRVTKYPMIPEELYGLQASVFEKHNFNLMIECKVPATCIIQKKTVPSNEGSSTEEPGSRARYGIHVNRNIRRGVILFSESTRLFSHTHPYDLTPGPCKNCLLDVPENRQADGAFEYTTAFCSNRCAREFARSVHVPEALFRHVLEDTVQWVNQKPGRHPLSAPDIANLDADYGGAMYVSYDRHIAAAIDVLERQGVNVFSGGPWDGCVVMDILARVQNSSRAFVEDEENSFVALTRFFSLINYGEANVAFTWKIHGITATVEVTASRDLRKGEELFVGPV
ncbi:hypothetical protein A1O7_04678 [Cladophialophora yegresii CBS 114405]|uniref:SET domain-containing protein n=1 Tax=Cladophialophora yegresii CBS 114405 TaxID=1182544 RepID=W9W6A6_9EURO|nr:uncharacterized protein A1O7_04678 [Cladophialophora yegresii CBS 114405]EXJ60525.1 hypothetical protein A1O7_04678 [Cladophialophora yegresii CBS 114405]